MKLIIVSILMGMAVAAAPADTAERRIPAVTDVYARMEASGDITEDSDMTLSMSDDELGDSNAGQDTEEDVKTDKSFGSGFGSRFGSRFGSTHGSTHGSTYGSIYGSNHGIIHGRRDDKRTGGFGRHKRGQFRAGTAFRYEHRQPCD